MSDGLSSAPKRPKVHEWGASLVVGKAGECRVLGLFTDTILWPGREGDLVAAWDVGERIEVKSEDYVPGWVRPDQETLFIERFSNTRKSSPGGPWQSWFEHSCRWTLHVMMHLPVLYVYDNQKMIEFMEANYTEDELRPVENETKWTLGWVLGWNPKIKRLDRFDENKLNDDRMKKAIRLGVLHRFTFDELPKRVKELLEQCEERQS
jgi:hypothetical protein